MPSAIKDETLAKTVDVSRRHSDKHEETVLPTEHKFQGVDAKIQSAEALFEACMEERFQLPQGAEGLDRKPDDSHEPSA